MRRTDGADDEPSSQAGDIPALDIPVLDVRASYDSAAEGYAELFQDGLARHVQMRALLAMFAELVREVDGPVLDVGCGPGHLTAHLQGLGLEVAGVDLSPAMIAIARRDHPDLSFTVGSMEALDVSDASLGGVLSSFSIVHTADDELPAVAAEFHRVLRPGGVVLVAFHVGEGAHHKTEGYGGHPMNLMVHRRSLGAVATLLRDAGLAIEAHLLLDPDAPARTGAVLARRP